MTHAPPPPTSTPDDAATEAFVTKLMEHRHRLYAFIAKQLMNPADVEDVFQRTSVILWQKMASFDPTGSFFHWACGVAFNEIRNYRRSKGRSRLFFDPDLMDVLSREAEQEENLSEARLRALRGCMERLSEQQRKIIRLCYEGSATITEVAQGLGRSRGALYKQLERLRGKLLACIRLRLVEEGWNS